MVNIADEASDENTNGILAVRIFRWEVPIATTFRGKAAFRLLRFINNRILGSLTLARRVKSFQVFFIILFIGQYYNMHNIE